MARSHGVLFSSTAWSRILVIALVVSVIISVAQADVDFKAMKVKELKAFLKKRGADCLACSSKEDYVDRAIEIKDWPEVEQKDEKAPEFDAVNFGDLFKDGNMDEEERMKKLKEALEKSGVDTSKLFNGNVLNAEELGKVFKDQKDPEMHDATDMSAEKTEVNAEKTEGNAEEAEVKAEKLETNADKTETNAADGAEAEAEAKTEL